MNCVFCNRNIANKGSLAAHQKVCNLNPQKIKFNRSPKAGRQKGCIAWNKGRTNIEIFGIKKAQELKVKYSEAIKKAFATKGSFWDNITDQQKEKFRNDHRLAINKRYENGWLPKAGRCKKIQFSSKFAGEVTVDGSWELKLANFFETNNIDWRRNKKRFPYNNEKNTLSYYTPDFYLPGYNIFIEVKGYETQKDRCKWRDFTEDLYVFKLKEIKKIQENVCFNDILKESKLIRN